MLVQHLGNEHVPVGGRLVTDFRVIMHIESYLAQDVEELGMHGISLCVAMSRAHHACDTGWHVYHLAWNLPL